MKTITCITLSLAFMGSYPKSEYLISSELAGIQLLMTIEQQKRTVRIMDVLDKHFEMFYKELDQLLYRKESNNKVERQNIELNDRSRDKLMNLTHKLDENFEDLKEAFGSVYFVNNEKGYKEYFDSVKEYMEYLKKDSGSINVSFLKEVHSRSQDVEHILQHIRRIVDESEHATQEEIRSKINEMSVAEWIFGYSN